MIDPDATDPAVLLDRPGDRLAALEAGAASHTGRVRSANEDRFFIDAAGGLFAVADGMGGHEAGEVASTAIVDSLASVGSAVSAADLLARVEDRILRANAVVLALARQRGKVVGSTVAILLIHGDHFACLWAGDSRIYRINGGRIAQISRDHTEVQELVEQGLLTAETAKTWPRRNVITRAIGIEDEPSLELAHGALAPGDTFVLCSDGLTGHVDDGEILAAADPASSAQDICQSLVELTLERGASDNVTVVAVRYAPIGSNHVSAGRGAQPSMPHGSGAEPA